MLCGKVERNFFLMRGQEREQCVLNAKNIWLYQGLTRDVKFVCGRQFSKSVLCKHQLYVFIGSLFLPSIDHAGFHMTFI